MEYARVQEGGNEPYSTVVTILILMEYVLMRSVTMATLSDSLSSFNPYYDGIYSMSTLLRVAVLTRFSSLNPYYDGICPMRVCRCWRVKPTTSTLNPYSNGRYSMRRALRLGSHDL